MGLPRETQQGPGSIAQEPSRPGPDPRAARAWSLWPQNPPCPSPPSCHTNMPQLAQASLGRFLTEQRAAEKFTVNSSWLQGTALTLPTSPGLLTANGLGAEPTGEKRNGGSIVPRAAYWLLQSLPGCPRTGEDQALTTVGAAPGGRAL